MSTATPTSEYELVLMLDPTTPEDQREKLAGEIRSRIEEAGDLRHGENWGVRKLAYEVRKQTEADYHLFRFQCESALLDELDHTLKIAEGVLRFRVFGVDARAPRIPPPPTVQAAVRPRRDSRDGKPRRGSDDRGGSGDRDSGGDAPAAVATPAAGPSTPATPATPEAAATEATQGSTSATREAPTSDSAAPAEAPTPEPAGGSAAAPAEAQPAEAAADAAAPADAPAVAAAADPPPAPTEAPAGDTDGSGSQSADDQAAAEPDQSA